MCCTRVSPCGNSGVFCFLPEYTENFAGKAKKRQNCNGKRKMPSLVAGLQQQGQRGNLILNKTAERIIMRKKLKKEGRPHGTGISARTIQHPSCGLDLQNPAPCGHRAGRCYVLHQSTPKWELWCFLLVPEYTENFGGKAKKRQNCNGKEKCPHWLQGCNSKGREETLY